MQLVAGVALFNEGRCPLPFFKWGQVAAHGACVHANLVALHAAEQVGYGLSERLAFYVPEGDIQARDGAPDRAAHFIGTRGSLHVVKTNSGVGWVFANERRREQVVNQRLDDGRLASEALPYSYETFVGMDENEGEAAVEYEAFDCGDFHCIVSGGLTSMDGMDKDFHPHPLPSQGQALTFPHRGEGTL